VAEYLIRQPAPRPKPAVRVCVPEGKGRTMTDLHNLDLSDIPEEQLTPAQREELERRFLEFLSAMRGSITGRKKAARRKAVTKWDPSQHGRKH